jgi:hypothetical protein
MADRFLLFDYLTRTAIAELPVVDSISYTETLDVDAGTIDLSGEGFMNYMRRRVLYSTRTFVATDQLAIVKNLIDYTQGLTSGNMGIDTTPLATMTTVARDRTYFDYEKKKIGEAIEQLAEVRDGFDFRLVPRWTNGPNSRYVLDFEVIFPALGRDTGYTFDVVAHDVTNVEVDLTRLAYRATAVGQGTGEDIPSVVLANDAQIVVNALVEDVVSVGDIIGTDTLSAHAQRRLDVGSAPLIYPNLVLDPSFLGSFIPGDRVHLVGGTGALDIGGVYRVAEQSFTVPAEGPEVLALTLAPLAAWLGDD